MIKLIFKAALMAAFFLASPASSQNKITLTCQPDKRHKSHMIVPQDVMMSIDRGNLRGRLSDSVLTATGNGEIRLKDVADKGDLLLTGHKIRLTREFINKAKLKRSQTNEVSYLYRIDLRAMTYRGRVLYGFGFNVYLTAKGTCRDTSG